MPNEPAQTLDVPSSSGGYVVRETVRFAYYVRKRNLDLAPAAYRAFERLIDQYPPPALSTFAIESGDWLDFNRQGLKDQVREVLLGNDRAINARVSVAGEQANIPDFAVEYFGRAIDRPVFRSCASVLWFSIGSSVFDPHKQAALDLHRELVRLLECSAAYVDFALEGDRPKLQALARRYINVDISRPTSVARDLADALPGVFWQTYLGPQLTAAVGGAAEISAVVSANTRVEPEAAGGLFITFGTEPQRGDLNRREDIQDRVAFARLVDAKQVLHLPRKSTYFDAEGDLSDVEAQERWHRRFVDRP